MRGHRQTKRDANHREIVEHLRSCGFSVLDLSIVGDGCPDLLVGAGGRNCLLEIKDGSAIPSKRKLKPKEEKFAAEWRGQTAVATSAAEAIQISCDACGVRRCAPVPTC